tara:strand:- start:11087 stop:11362 length:276 start_codon:yes stop_codon:yes gene_type:complete
MSMLEHDEWLENRYEQYQDYIRYEYQKHFSDNEMNIIKQIRLGKISMDSIREELLDFFTENPLPSDKIHDYTICSDEEILDRLDIDLGVII